MNPANFSNFARELANLMIFISSGTKFQDVAYGFLLAAFIKAAWGIRKIVEDLIRQAGPVGYSYSSSRAKSPKSRAISLC